MHFKPNHSNCLILIIQSLVVTHKVIFLTGLSGPRENLKNSQNLKKEKILYCPGIKLDTSGSYSKCDKQLNTYHLGNWDVGNVFFLFIFFYEVDSSKIPQIVFNVRYSLDAWSGNGLCCCLRDVFQILKGFFHEKKKDGSNVYSNPTTFVPQNLLLYIICRYTFYLFICYSFYPLPMI